MQKQAAIKIQQYPDEKDCLFCAKYGTLPTHKINFIPLLNRALYTKYSSDKKCLKKFDHLYENKPLPWVIHFKDTLLLDESDEYLKRYYTFPDQPDKFDQLLEYYKFHKDIPRLFMLRLSDVAIYYYEKQKQIEYRRIKMLLGIPIEDSQNNTKYEQLNEDVQLLKDITVHTHVSAVSLLRDMLSSDNRIDCNIDASWLTMTQATQKVQHQSQIKTKHLLKQLISKQQLNPNREIVPFSEYKSYSNQSPTNKQPQQSQLSIKNLIKDVSSKLLKQQSIKPQTINSSDSDFRKYIKQQILSLNHYNSCKSQKQPQQLVPKQPIQQSITYQSKQNSCHFLASTRSISQEQLKSSLVVKQKQPIHKKSQTHYTEISSPVRKDPKLQKLYTNAGDKQPIVSQFHKPYDKQLFKIYASPESISTNINININQLNMNNLNIKNPVQQYKQLLDNSPNKIKKLNGSGSLTLESQRLKSHKKSISQKIQTTNVMMSSIKQQQKMRCKLK